MFPELEGESGFAEQRTILELIESLGPRLVIPGHGAPFSDVDAALKRAHARLDAPAVGQPQTQCAPRSQGAAGKNDCWRCRKVALRDLVAHVCWCPLYRVITSRYFRMPFEDFVWQQVKELAADHAAARDGAFVINCDS